VRRFVVVGQSAIASDDFLLDDFPGTSGRLDVLARCVRAALLFSHGVRHDTVLYLVLLGGPRAPRTVRFDGATAKFVRPDERAIATLLRKTLATRADEGSPAFVEIRPGIAVAGAGLDATIDDLGGATPYVLEEGAPDLRAEAANPRDVAFFLGDHRGFDEATRARLAALGARAVSVGPVSLHTEDVVAVVSNELDRHAEALPATPTTDMLEP
jgi:tRNA (pseudouridine54-N1)-methyltransferase